MSKAKNSELINLILSKGSVFSFSDLYESNENIYDLDLYDALDSLCKSGVLIPLFDEKEVFNHDNMIYDFIKPA